MVRVELTGQGGQVTDALLSPRPHHPGTVGRDLHQHRPAVRGVRGPHGQAVPLDPAFSDERRLDAVEQLIPLAEEAGLSMPHLAMAFAISHPGVTSALLGARTMDQLDDLLAGVDTVLSDEVLDRIDEIVPPGTDIGPLDQAYVPPAIQKTQLRRRPLNERSAG